MSKQRKPALQQQLDDAVYRINRRLDVVSDRTAFLDDDRKSMDARLTKLSNRVEQLKKKQLDHYHEHFRTRLMVSDIEAFINQTKRIGKILLYSAVIGLALHSVVYFVLELMN